MIEAQKQLVKNFPQTAEGKAFYLFMLEELEKLKDVTTVTGGEVELKARIDAIKYIRDILSHFRQNVVEIKKPKYD